ncbi:helix-turn-helix domain-containing protein [Labilibacter marinus]|uniref:helix-turn-helix domain-containing protein n=1 Tax=Labilibacter marinus TaxID=1477105 RepID=UPI00094F5530|nr:helix-turn-helix domain-containing protein [Labilibacter marinus]
MSELTPKEQSFLSELDELIRKNISNEQFGVAELASEIGMSRSNLLRKVKKLAQVSVSKYISQIRLQDAYTLLKQDELTVSEVSYQVGFASTSYFIRCFREQYGYPPGEVKNKVEEVQPLKQEKAPVNKRYLMVALALLIGTIALLYIFIPRQNTVMDLDKTIAVLPFKNESADSSNIYIVNGMMESVLSSLQKMKGLKVVSRTTVEQYRNTTKTIPEIAHELNVSYFVEGSGQKVGNQIMLNVQLVQSNSDRQLWAKQYKREVEDIFQLQIDVAKNIANNIEVIITPEEQKRIEKVPTQNLEAYDTFLKGLELFRQETGEGLEESIVYFKKAIELDENFARAYADIAIAYYYLDAFFAEKKHSAKINYYADKALLLDAHLGQSLQAKAYYYINIGEYAEAIPFLEKALEYNPNSVLIINTLSDFYTTFIPNAGKYLEYALKGIQLDLAAQDSSSASYVHLHLSNAFMQTGFVEEAEQYINSSLAFNPDNLYSQYVKAYILLGKDKNYARTKDLLFSTLLKDTTRLDILQEVAKVNYLMRNYSEAYVYYKDFLWAKETYKLRIFPSEDIKMALVCKELGYTQKADSLSQAYFQYASNDESIYKNLSLSAYYSYQNNTEKAIEHLGLFAQQTDIQYWIVLFLREEPAFDNIIDMPACQALISQIEDNFNKYHENLKSTLQSQGLIE